MAIVRRKTTSGSNSKRSVIKVNIYESAENVMALMAKICSATPNVETENFWQIISDAYNNYKGSGVSLNEYIKENRSNLCNTDFHHDLVQYCERVACNLNAHENTEHTQVVVAGGFSSGKSSFLNRLTGSVNLLPTGVEPVSVVKTYLYCSNNCRSISVKGINHKNVVVNLDTSVLQAIQHSKKSNVYLASVLDKIFVEIPSMRLEHLVFIDTPGYNNSDKANVSNGKTDRETALEAMSEGNVLFWLVDCERGTVISDDIDIINRFEGKKVFIFNKADKKGVDESRKIVDAASEILYREFADDIIDVLAYSTLDDRIYYSKNNMTLDSIIAKVKNCGNGNTELQSLVDGINKLFEIEIEASRDLIKDIEDRYKQNLADKNEAQEEYNNVKECANGLLDKLNEVFYEGYDKILAVAENIAGSSLNAVNEFGEFLGAVGQWDTYEHECFNNTLTPILNRYSKIHDKCVNKHNRAIEYQYYTEDYRKQIIEEVKRYLDWTIGEFEHSYKAKCEICKDSLSRKESENEMVAKIGNYQEIFMSALRTAINNYKKNDSAVELHNDEQSNRTIFESIAMNDYKAFLQCFEDGVDCTMCNAEGYNPLTLSVKTGNYNMVKFFLDHNIDLSIIDNRGYNAFHTAVECQYRNICELLLDVCPELAENMTASGLTVEELAKKTSFQDWVLKSIDATF